MRSKREDERKEGRKETTVVHLGICHMKGGGCRQSVINKCHKNISGTQIGLIYTNLGGSLLNLAAANYLDAHTVQHDQGGNIRTLALSCCM